VCTLTKETEQMTHISIMYEDGERKDYSVLNPETERKINKNSDKSYKEMMEREQRKRDEWNKGKHWSAAYHDAVKVASEQINNEEAGCIMHMLTFLNVHSNGRLEHNNKPLSKNDIALSINKKPRRTYSILKKLEDIGVLLVHKEGRNNVYFINAEYHSMGVNIKQGMHFTKLFKHKTKDVIKDLSLHDAGILYKMLPYFHFQSFYLSDKPNEDLREDPSLSWDDNVKKKTYKTASHLNQQKWATLLGCSRTSLNKCFAILSDLEILMRQKVGSNKTTYMIHPDVMYRMEQDDSYYKAFVIMQFEHNKEKKNQ